MLGKTVELSEQSLFHFTKLVTPGKVEKLGDGATIQDSIRAVEEYGICPLSEWHYNPESWNYVEDPYNEGQGKALQRKLAAAQQYRFRNWRTLSCGSVLQFKQALSAGFPVYTGVVVTTDWDDDAVRKSGSIPFPRLFWLIRVQEPPQGLVEEILAANGIDPESEEAGEVAQEIVVKLMRDTLQYVGNSVFGCEFSVCESKVTESGVELVVRLEKFDGGHALCLAGYVDDEAYPGGGYFIARNSWSDDGWAPESPEMPGYALLPYDYVAVLGDEGVVMSDFPSREKTLPEKAARGTEDRFPAWLAGHVSVLDRPTRDEGGLMLMPGTSVLVPDLSNPNKILRDTPQNRARLRDIFGKEEGSCLATVVRDVADESFGRQRWILSIEEIQRQVADRGWTSATPKEIRKALLALQAESADTYALCINQFGREEFRHASVLGERKRVF